MSLKGIKAVANIFSEMQSTRIKLLGSKNKAGEVDKQDVRLGQLLEKAKDAIKWEFTKETLKSEVRG